MFVSSASRISKPTYTGNAIILILLSNDPVSVHIYAHLALSVLAVVDLLVYSPIMQAASQTGLLMLELQIFKIFIT